eukprot:CAMPEP_0172533976 /NCGR_PEP_ID=MMETSP1067-20121228/6510_1 /TAXON_ID=265564 ORGANISM="Thalassiosira punctigera, Strain Tpunct2005C2" /NCGR_SAMPLE_ID=MMETSP1067 /ASSEMBLY_ACC=CAM_ASM_000444 /LENGTH=626 /DNA_ID=CAMNT_0013318703 /DNA_START=106 /DNA_END=1986 /DNA_ORIENTATION=-
MVAALALFARRTASASRPAILARGAMKGWLPLPSSSFVPPTSSRRRVTMERIADVANCGAKRGSSMLLNARRSHLVMWGEEDAPNQRRPVRDVIPSSKFSSDSGGGRSSPARRPTRRSRPSSDRNDRQGGWNNDDDWFNNDEGGGGYEPYVYDRRPSSDRGRGGQQRGKRGRDSGGGRGRGGRDLRREPSRGRGGRVGNARGGRRDGREGKRSEDGDRMVKINLKLIENAGYQHLYGIAPVLNALKADVRDFADPKEDEEDETQDLMELRDRLSNVDGIDDDFSAALDEELFNDGGTSSSNDKKKNIKPEAMLCPHLFVQEGTLDNSKRSFRSLAKSEASAEILTLAKERGVPVVEVDKGILNTLCMNRPHQGFVLRCGSLDFEPLRVLPSSDDGKGGRPSLWLALDEVVDPQNLGALLRSAYFLGHGPGVVRAENDGHDNIPGGGQVGILVCSKNSSPLTPTVSAASAGALEFMTIYSTSNLPRLLNGAKEEGWRILGAAAEVPDGVRYYSGSNTDTTTGAAGGNDWDLGNDSNDDSGNNAQQQQCLDLHKVKAESPTVLVLGSEGRGLRTLVARACTGFVSIPGGGGSGVADDHVGETQAGVDSLNVSVTGGILLWHFLSNQST